MSNEKRVPYTDLQKSFVRKMLKNITEAQEYWKNDLDVDTPYASFYTELHPFMELVSDSLLAENNLLAKKAFDLIETFLINADQESKDAIAYFFFEDLTNRLGKKNKKYMQILIKLLGPNCKECCRTVDIFWKTKTPGLWDK